MKRLFTPLANHHLNSVVNLHLRAFPGFFLSFLGPRFLREFYAAFTTEPKAVAYVTEEVDTGRILGVIVGTVEPVGFFSKILRHSWWSFCLASLIALCRRPWIATRLFRALYYRGDPPSDSPRALLSSIAIAPEAQGAGVGRALLSHWVRDVQSRGSAGCYLTTDAVGNDSVNKFYQSAGWTLRSTFITPEGRKMNRYIMDFDNFKSLQKHSSKTDLGENI